MTFEDQIKTLQDQIILLSKAVNELQDNQCQHCDECFVELPPGMDETPEETREREDSKQQELVVWKAYLARESEAIQKQLAVDRQKAQPLRDLSKRDWQVSQARAKATGKPAGPGPGFNYPPNPPLETPK